MEWRRRRWRRLLNLIEFLPRDSAYIEALSNDEEIAQQLLDKQIPERPPQRRMSEYSAVVEVLSLVADRIAELIGTVAASRGIKPRRIQPAPRPVTALERLRKRRRRIRHRSLVSKLLPHKREEPDPLPPHRGRDATQPQLPGRVGDRPRSGRDLMRRSGWRGQNT